MDDVITAVRRFNRFYTQLVGALNARFLGMAVTLPEGRLLFEIAQAGAAAPVTATRLQAALGMDAGFVSRILRRFAERGWIARGRGGADPRARPLRLTAAGEDAFADLDRRQRAAVAELVAPLDAPAQADLAGALARARLLLRAGDEAACRIRPFRTGDLGDLAARQAILYQADQGWGRPLEVLLLETVAAFLRGYRPGRDGGWIAELDGAAAGAVLITDEGAGTARLRLLHVEPFARRRGIGDALVAACLHFAREAGYAQVTLWTHTVLADARRLYARHGFTRADVAEHALFGVPVTGETWTLVL